MDRVSIKPKKLTPEKKVYRGIAIIMFTILSCYVFRFLVHFHAAVKP